MPGDYGREKLQVLKFLLSEIVKENSYSFVSNMRTHHGNGNNAAVKCFSSSSSKTSRHVSALIFLH